jgi:hypothetical protein
VAGFQEMAEKLLYTLGNNLSVENFKEEASGAVCVLSEKDLCRS